MTEDKDLKELEDAMKEMFIHGKIDMNEEVTITNIRHKEALMEAKNYRHAKAYRRNQIQ